LSLHCLLFKTCSYVYFMFCYIIQIESIFFTWQLLDNKRNRFCPIKCFCLKQAINNKVMLTVKLLYSSKNRRYNFKIPYKLSSILIVYKAGCEINCWKPVNFMTAYLCFTASNREFTECSFTPQCQKRFYDGRMRGKHLHNLRKGEYP